MLIQTFRFKFLVTAIVFITWIPVFFAQKRLLLRYKSYRAKKPE